MSCVYAFRQCGHQCTCDQCYQNMLFVEHNITIENVCFFPIQMETINDLLYFLNKLDSTDKVNDDDLENLRCVRRILVREFEDYNLDKLLQVLCLVDCLFVLIKTGSLNDVLGSTNTSRGKYFLSNQF